MHALQSWSLARVLLLSGAWILLCLVAAVAWLAVRLGIFSAASAGSGGIGAVSIGINVLLAILVGPPIMLIVLWLVARWR
jgi:hypothetical protein